MTTLTVLATCTSDEAEEDDDKDNDDELELAGTSCANAGMASNPNDRTNKIRCQVFM
ncbi:MAG TPA: hypothetical protein VG962_03435 [Steroidobacteraceae bacterium]|nr:hypothetical protein [Steroidobacteraceae bacterium]